MLTYADAVLGGDLLIERGVAAGSEHTAESEKHIWQYADTHMDKAQAQDGVFESTYADVC
jgi:hypothetical protein